MVKLLRSEREIYEATQNESHTIVYFANTSTCSNSLHDREYENLEILYPNYYFYKVEVESFVSWSSYAQRNKIVALPIFSYFTNNFQYASYYAFSPVNKTLLDTLEEFDEEYESDYSIETDNEWEDTFENEVEDLFLKGVSKFAIS